MSTPASSNDRLELERLCEEVARLQKALRESEDMLGIAPAFFGFLTLEGVVQSCNQLALQAIEAAAEEVVGRVFWDGAWWQPLPRAAAAVREAVAEAALGRSSHFDTEYWSIQGGVGRKRWVSLGISPVRDERGNISRIAATGVDITEQQEGQEALRRSEDRLWEAVEASEEAKRSLQASQDALRRIVELTRIGSWEIDLRTQEGKADARCRELLGLAPAESFNLERRLSLIHPEDRPRVSEALAGAIAGKDSGRYWLWYRTLGTPASRPRWIESRGQVSFGPDGTPLRLLGTVADATAWKEPPPTENIPTGGIHDFDFLIGSWNVLNRRLKKRFSGSSDWEEFPATSRCWQHMGGVVNVEEMRFQTKGFSGMSLRAFAKQERRWSIYWMDGSEGVLFPPVRGGFSGERGEFLGEDIHDGRPVKVRFVWTRLGPDRSRWEQAFSLEGTGWESNWVMDFTRADAASQGG
jgi:PAS domain S-box-containing protein